MRTVRMSHATAVMSSDVPYIIAYFEVATPIVNLTALSTSIYYSVF